MYRLSVHIFNSGDGATVSGTTIMANAVGYAIAIVYISGTSDDGEEVGTYIDIEVVSNASFLFDDVQNPDAT